MNLVLLIDPPDYSGIIMCMRPVKERRHYTVTSSLIGWAHTQKDPWLQLKSKENLSCGFGFLPMPQSSLQIDYP